jgi:hypothetical protein
MAAGQGLEPRISGPKPEVLPLHYPAITLTYLSYNIYIFYLRRLLFSAEGTIAQPWEDRELLTF